MNKLWKDLCFGAGAASVVFHDTGGFCIDFVQV